MCYRSWQPYDENKPEATNPNVTRVRQGNDKYIGHVLEVGHGSILEHVSMNFIIQNCSRVFTHELVRHRAGTAFSQESLRFVRLDDIRFWIPQDAENNPEAKSLFLEAIDYMEKCQKRLADIFGIDKLKDFGIKKRLTSMFRRLAGDGLATCIGFTANLRSLRHIIAMRTSEGAEEEIRIIFDDIAIICKREYPNVFQDMVKNDKGEWVFENWKV
jgi:thymidylate synthase (FAD)